MGIDSPVTAATVAEIVALQDPVLRNLWITTAYHDFAVRLSSRLGVDATWCAFAVWASRTAGATIRNEELPNALKELLDDSPEYSTAVANATVHAGALERFGLAECLGHHHVMNVVGSAAAQVSSSLAAGNVLVFGELGPLFVAFCEQLESASTADPASLRAAVGAVLDASPDRGGQTRAGVEFAFACYADAAAEPDPKKRAELVFAANVAAVAHEQQRLQPNVKSALDAALDVALPTLVLDATPQRLRGVVARVMAIPLREVAVVLNRVWDTVATCELMRFATADEDLRLDRDLPPLADGAIYPPDLVRLDEERAIRMWDQWRPHNSASARDWERLDTRMNFIVHLFRSRQQHLPLLRAPYAPEQLAAMRQGIVPGAPL